MAISDARREQAYPILSALQIGAARRFASGEPRRFGPVDVLYEIGTRNVPAWLVLEGSADAIQRGATGKSSIIGTYGPGQFTGETNQLSGHATLASVVAGDKGVRAIPFDAPHLRALVIGSADVGEAIMRAFILRRVSLIEEGESVARGQFWLGAGMPPASLGCLDFSPAMAIPTPSSPHARPRGTNWSNGSASHQKNCR